MGVSVSSGFKPTEDELNEYYLNNQQKVYEYMVFEMDDHKEEIDPLSNFQAVEFYHYYETLKQIKI